MNRVSGCLFYVCLSFTMWSKVNAQTVVTKPTPPAGKADDGRRPGKTIVNTLGMKLVLVPDGEFTMGSDESLAELEQVFGKLPDQSINAGENPAQRLKMKLSVVPDGKSGLHSDESLAEVEQFLREQAGKFTNLGEHPAHRVKITKPFYMAANEVTIRQFRMFVEAEGYQTDAAKRGKGGWGWSVEEQRLVQKPEFDWQSWGFKPGDDHPVVNVSFNDAKAFCAWLSAKEGKTYRLPTEAEWEYACRAGSETRFYSGDDAEGLLKIGNVHGFNLELASSAKLKGKNITVSRVTQKPKDGHIFTAPVGRFQHNQFGLYDMTGNASEWCCDWYDEDYYTKSPPEDPPGAANGSVRAVRGGGWDDDPVRCRSSFRASAGPADCYGSLGFRVVMDLERGEARVAAVTPASAAETDTNPPADKPCAGEVFTNTQGMKLALVPAGEFTMGSDETRAGLEQAFGALPEYLKPEWIEAENPGHRVRITKPFYLGVHEVTKGQFRQFVEADDYRTDAETDGKGGMGWSENDQKFERKPEYTWQSWGVEQPDDHPVVNVTFNDAMAYCAWLSKKEGKMYRLPTEAQWEYACRAGSDTRFYHGDGPEGLVRFGNVADATLKEKFSGANTIQAKDGYVFTAPVGWFRANKFGLYDMAGNAMEWCSDWYDREFYGVSPAEDPQGSDAGSERVIRGGAWLDVPVFVRSAHRRAGDPATHRLSNLGFRVVLDLEQAAAPVAARTPAADGEPEDERPDDKVIAVETITNALGMKLALIPSGKFTMGSDESPADLQQAFGKLPDFLPPELIAGEGPAHSVKITKPFYMGMYEVTKGEFRQFVEADDYKTEAEKDGQGGFGWSEEDKDFGQKIEYTWRSVGFEQADDHPVVNVSFNDAQAFCVWLSAKERKTYRLPTEAEWEYACRAGSNTRFYNGNAPERTVRIGNVADATAKAKFTWWKSTTKAKDGFAFTAPVGQFRRNQFGLYDMTGNTWEWCSDWFDMEYYGKSPPDDPTGPTTGTFRVIRGGAWLYMPVACRSAMRNGALPVGLNSSTGFRVVLDVEPGSAHVREETPPLRPKAK